MTARVALCTLLLGTPALALPQATLPTPRAVWFTFDDYPREAVIQREQGRVGYRLTIGTDGRVRDCSIIATSGHDRLDQQTCAVLTRRAKLEPARDANGQALESEYVGVTRWELPPGPVKPPEPFRDVSIDLLHGKPHCVIDWDGALRDLKPQVCRDMAGHLPHASVFPVKLRVSATPRELGFE